MRPFLLASILLLVSFGSLSAQSGAGDVAAVESVLAQYKSALERLNLDGVDALFAPENVVVESGKLEGDYAEYLSNHIGPELGHISSFEFSNYAVRTRVEGELALATETYHYTLALKDKAEPIVRQGVNTVVLKKLDGRWRIISMHMSSRPAKKAGPPPAAK